MIGGVYAALAADTGVRAATPALAALLDAALVADVGGSSRAQGWSIIRSPALNSWAWVRVDNDSSTALASR